MKKFFICLAAILGFHQLANSNETYLSCEEELSKIKDQNLVNSQILIGTKKSPHLHAFEHEILQSLLKKAKVQQMDNSHECEIAD